MKYIEKQDAPQFFLDDTNGKISWDEYDTGKQKLRGHILHKEQAYLCCYCEKKIAKEAESSHIEHLKPKEHYPDLTFNYNNIAVSCQGNHFNDPDDSTKYTCGHKKDNDYDDDLFLNPTVEQDINTYFKFDDDGVIDSSGKNDTRAKYMIDLANLNGTNSKLAETRKIKLDRLRNRFRRINDIDKRKTDLRRYLNRNNLEFMTFLQYKYQKLLDSNDSS